MKKVAVIVYGVTRGQADKTAPAFKKVFLEELKKHFEVKTFLHCFSVKKMRVCQRGVPPLTGPQARATINIENLDDWKLFSPDKYLCEPQEEFEKSFDYDSYINGHKDAFANGYITVKHYLNGLNSLKKSFSLSLAEKFDCYLILRLDLLYQNNDGIMDGINFLLSYYIDHPLEKYLPHIFVPKWNSGGGTNDRMALAEFKEAQIYCNRIDDYAKIADRKGKGHPHSLHSEKMLKKLLNVHKIKEKYFTAYGARIRADGSTVYN